MEYPSLSLFSSSTVIDNITILDGFKYNNNVKNVIASEYIVLNSEITQATAFSNMPVVVKTNLFSTNMLLLLMIIICSNSLSKISEQQDQTVSSVSMYQHTKTTLSDKDDLSIHEETGKSSFPSVVSMDPTSKLSNKKNNLFFVSLSDSDIPEKEGVKSEEEEEVKENVMEKEEEQEKEEQVKEKDEEEQDEKEEQEKEEQVKEDEKEEKEQEEEQVKEDEEEEQVKEEQVKEEEDQAKEEKEEEEKKEKEEEQEAEQIKEGEKEQEQVEEDEKEEKEEEQETEQEQVKEKVKEQSSDKSNKVVTHKKKHKKKVTYRIGNIRSPFMSTQQKKPVAVKNVISFPVAKFGKPVIHSISNKNSRKGR